MINLIFIIQHNHNRSLAVYYKLSSLSQYYFANSHMNIPSDINMDILIQKGKSMLLCYNKSACLFLKTIYTTKEIVIIIS